jgi:hypothetical protein
VTERAGAGACATQPPRRPLSVETSRRLRNAEANVHC